MDQEVKHQLQQTPMAWTKPQMFRLSESSSAMMLKKLLASGSVTAIFDEIERAYEELYHIEFPGQIDGLDQDQYEAFKKKLDDGDSDRYGVWVFYPWNGHLVHMPEQDHLRALRTSRNRNLVTADEQKKLFKATILIVGLSVGSNAVDALLTQGIGGRYILIDTDVLDPTNLNRIRSSYDNLGLHKVDNLARRISELDPFIDQVHYHDGLTRSNISDILEQYKPDVIMDEMDSLEMKILLRHEAQRLRLPLLMATDDGDDILFDVERYDETPNLPILHGRLPEDLVERILNGQKLPRAEAGRVIGQYFVGLENVPLRMIESLREVGRTLPSWPQLGGAATLAGITLAYAAKRILLDLPLRSGRFLIGPDQSLNPEIDDPQHQAALQKAREQLMNPDSH